MTDVIGYDSERPIPLPCLGKETNAKNVFERIHREMIYNAHK